MNSDIQYIPTCLGGSGVYDKKEMTYILCTGRYALQRAPLRDRYNQLKTNEITTLLFELITSDTPTRRGAHNK